MATVLIQETLNNSHRLTDTIFHYRKIGPFLFSAMVWKGLLCELLAPFVVTWLQFGMGYKFLPYSWSLHLPLASIGSVLPSITFFYIHEWPLCNDSTCEFLKLCGIINLLRYAMQSSSMLRSSLRAQYLFRAGSTSVVIGPPLKQLLV